MKTKREWHFVKNLAKKQTKTRRGKHWFIGLKRFDGSCAWSWLNKTIAWNKGDKAMLTQLKITVRKKKVVS